MDSRHNGLSQKKRGMNFQTVFIIFSVALSAHGFASWKQGQKPDDVPLQGNSLYSEWTKYKRAFKKTYDSAAQEKYRRYVWEENIAAIKVHNKETAMGRHTYWMGVNQFTDMSTEEFNSMMLTDMRLPSTNVTADKIEDYVMLQLPASVDWREKNLVTNVKDQACFRNTSTVSTLIHHRKTVESTTGAIEGQHAKKTGNLVSLSEQQLVDCSWSYGNHGCKNGTTFYAYKYVVAAKGLDTERCYPYTARDGKCNSSASCIGSTVRSYKLVTGGELNLQKAVAAVGPISVVVTVSDKFRHYSSGIFVDDGTCEKAHLKHAMLVVGYEPAYWIVKNSWGTYWGMSGYIHWARGKNMCGIASFGSYPVV